MKELIPIETETMRKRGCLAAAYRPNDGVLLTTGKAGFYVGDVDRANDETGLHFWTDDMNRYEFHNETPPGLSLSEGEFLWGSLLTFSKNGKYLASGSQNPTTKSLQIYDGINRDFIKSLALVSPRFRDRQWEEGDAAVVMTSAFSPTEEARLALPCRDGLLRICDLETGSVDDYPGFPGGAYVVFFTFYSKKEISSDARGAACEKNREYWILGGYERLESRNIDSGETIVREFRDGMLRRYIWLEKSEQIFCIAESGGDRERRGEILLLSGDALETQEEYKVPVRGTVDCLAYSAFDDLVAIGLFGGDVVLWDVKKREICRKSPKIAENEPIVQMAFSPRDSSLIVVFGSGGSIVYSY